MRNWFRHNPPENRNVAKHCERLIHSLGVPERFREGLLASLAGKENHSERVSKGFPEPAGTLSIPAPTIDPEPEPEPDKKEAPRPPTRGSDDDPLARQMTMHPSYDEVRRRFLKHWPHLGRKNASDINRWLQAGADPEQDIYPTIQHVLNVKGGDVGSFTFFERQVLSSVQARRDMDDIFKRMEAKHG